MTLQNATHTWHQPFSNCIFWKVTTAPKPSSIKVVLPQLVSPKNQMMNCDLTGFFSTQQMRYSSHAASDVGLPCMARYAASILCEHIHVHTHTASSTR